MFRAQEWDAVAALPIDAVWLMGIWQRSPIGRAIALAVPQLLDGYRAALPNVHEDDVLGSPYCVRDYVVDERFGGPGGLAVAREQLQTRGLALILDYVPNHIAADHPWVTDRPECLLAGSEDDLLLNPKAFMRIAGGVYAKGRDPTSSHGRTFCSSTRSPRRSGRQRPRRSPRSAISATGCERSGIVNFMILTYGSQQDYDELTGKPSERPIWSPDDFVAMASFMRQFASELEESGELVETRGLSAPVHARRVNIREGVPVVTDGPFAEAQEVLAGYWIVDCDSFDRRRRSPAGFRAAPPPSTYASGPTPT